MFKCWFTAPKNKGFSSFYYYQPDTKEFCRIRLELNRYSRGRDDGRTSVFYHPYRAVGFSARNDLDYNKRQLWRIHKIGKGDRLLYQGGLLLNAEPNRDEKYIYDSANTCLGIHKGNPVIPFDEAILPLGIRKYHLLKLAKIAVMWKKDIYLTPKNASPEQLANKILAEINFPRMICDVVARI
ncbi:hypothetical protein [Kosakonia sp. MUSA4]|uniref:hypothetical protein n=1 Tax=Kosakonia sp. MUSA4 TaxID=2067958 RepID=UPI001AC00499|nr:hypothetical protein [Kosakonia sp. MUSA4]